jgi:hypothetical protein
MSEVSRASEAAKKLVAELYPYDQGRGDTKWAVDSVREEVATKIQFAVNDLLQRDMELTKVAGEVLQAFEDGIFVRATHFDTEPSWALKILGPLQSLSKLKNLHEKTASLEPWQVAKEREI